MIKDHRTFLKKSFNKHTLGQVIPLFYHKRTVVDPQMLLEESVVDKILKHRVTPEGKIEFYVKWLGYDEDSAGWEPVRKFFHQDEHRHHKILQGEGSENGYCQATKL
jgi:hypothetical protein